jgi:hypothetical protein
MTVALVQYDPTDAAIAEMKQRLKADLFDCSTTSGYEGCRKAIAEVRAIRVNVEKHRKFLKEESLEYGRKVDSEAKRITAELESIEEPLKAKKQAIDDEKERVKREAEEKRLAAIKAEQDRVAAEAEAKRQAEIAAENARMAAEREALRVEQEKLAVERAKVEAERKAQEETARIERVGLEVLGELGDSPDAFYQRTQMRLAQLSAKLLEWGTGAESAAVVERLRGRTGTICAGLPAGDPGRANCEAFLRPAAQSTVGA